MANIPAVCAALASQVGRLAYPPLRSLAEPMDQVNPPVGIVVPARPFVKYATTLEGATGFGPVLGGSFSLPSREIMLDYLILVAKASTLERVEAGVYTWLGFESDANAVSVPAAVEADPTLGGLAEWCVPLTADPPAPLDYNGVAMIGARIHFSLSVH